MCKNLKLFHTYFNLSVSLDLRLARHCFTMKMKVAEFVGFKPSENRSRWGVSRTKHKWSFGSHCKKNKISH